MKVKVSKWVGPRSSGPAMDAWFLHMIGNMPGECYERIALKYGKEHWLYQPSRHGEKCPSNGSHPGIECRCDECDHYLICFPDWRKLMEEVEKCRKK